MKTEKRMGRVAAAVVRLALPAMLVLTVCCTQHLGEPEMVFVKGGTFEMGSPDEIGYENEHPAHRVTLNDFKIGKFETTQGQWKAVMGGNHSRFQNGDDYPVDNVTWDEAQEFIAKLNKLTGKHYRLPTEAEWEYAARGGNRSIGYQYSGSDNKDEVAWYANNSGGSTQPVGTKQPNELGIYDMSGNVWEWCSDLYDLNVRCYPSEDQTNPTGATAGFARVFRGGCWSLNYDGCCRSARRDFGDKGYCNSLGFRIVLP
jgi:formylglycine-generating enzyme required for sulfatase activity